MSWETVAKCDVCGRVKQEANKWLVVYCYTPDMDSATVPYFTVYHWDKSNTGGAGAEHICGEECLQKKLRTFLDLRSKIPPLQKENKNNAAIS